MIRDVDPVALREQISEWRLDVVTAANALKQGIATGQIIDHQDMAYALIDSLEEAAKQFLTTLGTTTETLIEYRGEVGETIAILRSQIDTLRADLARVSKGGPIF